MTLRVRVLCGFVIAVIGVVLASMQIVDVLRDAHAAERAVNTKWAPASSTSKQLLSHMIDQETGERGYVITGDAAFLDPYTTGRQAAAEDLVKIDMLIGDNRTIAVDLAAVKQRWQRWLTAVAEPEVAARRASSLAQSQQLVDIQLGKTLFGDVRASIAALQSDVSLLSGHEQRRQAAAVGRLDRAFLATLAGGGTLVVLFLVLVNAWVLRPLAALRRRLRHATAGAFRDPIAETGPPELREVARDAESLRLRLVHELEESENARQALEQRGPVVRGLSDRLTLTDLPPIAGLRIANVLHPAEGVVAGDLLDVVQIDGRRVGLVIADVSGHGAVAGLEAVTLKQAISTALRLGRNPAEALDVAADQGRLDERFATCAIVVIDVATGELTYANAGHLPPVIVPALSGVDAAIEPGQLRPLEPTGPLLSVLARGWHLGSARLAPGEVLLLLTDGLLEARSVAGEEFGLDGVCKALSAATIRDVDTAVTALTAAAYAHAYDYNRDDVTVLAVMRDLATAPSIDLSRRTGAEAPAIVTLQQRTESHL